MKKKGIYISEAQLQEILLELSPGNARDILLGKIRIENKRGAKINLIKPKPRVNPLAKTYRDELVKNATKAEKRFKAILRKLKIRYKFQYIYHLPKQFYIIDFFLPDYKIAIEIDGWYHNSKAQQKKDRKRDRNIEYKILVYTNEQVLKQEDLVIESLTKELSL